MFWKSQCVYWGLGETGRVLVDKKIISKFKLIGNIYALIETLRRTARRRPGGDSEILSFPATIGLTRRADRLRKLPLGGVAETRTQH